MALLDKTCSTRSRLLNCGWHQWLTRRWYNNKEEVNQYRNRGQTAQLAGSKTASHEPAAGPGDEAPKSPNTNTTGTHQSFISSTPRHVINKRVVSKGVSTRVSEERGGGRHLFSQAAVFSLLPTLSLPHIFTPSQLQSEGFDTEPRNFFWSLVFLQVNRIRILFYLSYRTNMQNAVPGDFILRT